MIIKFIKGGKSSKIVDYVLKESSAKNKILLSGNGELTKQIIDSSSFKNQNYHHITLSQNGAKNISVEHWKVIFETFKKEMFVGLNEKEFNILGVVHDNEHIHLVVPKVNLLNGKDLQLFMDKIDRKRVNLIRDLIHCINWKEHNLSEIELEHPSNNVVENKLDTTKIDEILNYRTKYENSNFNGLDKLNISNSKEKKEVIKTIQNAISDLKKDGFLNSPKEVLQFLGNNFEVKKSGFDTKFISGPNVGGYYVACEFNQKTIRIPIKELNNEQFKNNKDRTNEQFFDKNRDYEKTRFELNKENERRKKTIKSREGRLEKIKDFALFNNIDNNIVIDFNNKLESIAKQQLDSKSSGTNDKQQSRQQSCGVEFGKIQSNERGATKMSSIKEKIKELKLSNGDVALELEYEANLKVKTFNDISNINIAQQSQINLKDRIPFIKQNINMKEYLENNGVDMVSRGYNNYLCRSPLRSDKNPSFGVFFDINKEVWMYHDFATQESGTIIDLDMKLNNYSINDSISSLLEQSNNPKTENITLKPMKDHNNKVYAPTTKETKNVDIVVRDLFDYRLKHYLENRKIFDIPSTIKEMNKNQFNNGKINRFSYIAFRNDSNGYVLRNSGFKGNEGATSISSIDNAKDTTIVVEGFFDYLSLYQKYGNNYNYVSLNSITNLNKLELKSNQKYILGLDNDSGGIEANLKIIEKYPNHNISVMTPIGKDFNEDLMNQHNMQYSSINALNYVKKHKSIDNIDKSINHHKGFNR